MLRQKPLVAVLIAQVVLLVGAIGFLIVRAVAAPVEPHPRRAAEAPEEVHVPLPKLAEKAAEPALAPTPSTSTEWETFPGGTPAKLSEEDDAPAPAKAAASTPAAPENASLEGLVAELAEGNDRFVEGVSRQRDPLALRTALAHGEKAKAVVVTCTDSRVVPELVFDQPMGTFSVVRLPGAQLDELGVYAVEEAVGRLHPRAVLVMGHFGCHHVKQSLSEAAAQASPRKNSLAGVLSPLLKSLEGQALDEAATASAVSFSARELRRKSKVLAKNTEVATLRVVYAPATGKLRWLDAEADPQPQAPVAQRAGRR